VKAVEDMGPARWPERQHGHDEYDKQLRHRHLHKAKLRRVFGHEPARHNSRGDE
jgi:hypothetical protein